MKKSIYFRSLLMLALFPSYLYAQEIQLPTIEIMGNRDKIPSKVKEAFMNDFGECHEPFVWATSQTHFVTNGLEQSADVDNIEVNYYAFHTSTSTGSSLSALYSPDGKLIRSREYLKNFCPAQNIVIALQNSDYKDWYITRNFHIIKVSSKGTEKDQCALILKKGKEKKVIYFDPNGGMIISKKGELAYTNW